MVQLQIPTDKNRQMVDITDDVSKQVPTNGQGIIHVFAQHTTCAVTTIDSDPGIDLDLFDFLSGITPDIQWRHPHNPVHAPAHLISSIIGPEVLVPLENGRLQLGTWQRIVLIELDGPRERNIAVTILNS